MEEKKRKGYSTKEGQKEADKRYLEKHPEAKEKKKISAMKSNAKRFIKEFAKIEDLEELENLINIKKLGGRNMNKIIVRRMKENKKGGVIEKYNINESALNSLMKVYEILDNKYFVDKNKLNDYFGDINSDNSMFSKEEWENIKEICNEDNYLNGNLYFIGIREKEYMENICSFFKSKNWLETETFDNEADISILRIYKGNYKLLKEKLSKEELEELERIIDFIEIDNWGMDFTISK